MHIQQLRLANLRAFQQAEFAFQPSMNLIVGINGVGKSTVLHALRVLLSQTLPKFTDSKSKPITFSSDDISLGADALTAEMVLGLSYPHFEPFTIECLVHKQREKHIPNIESKGVVRDQTVTLQDRAQVQAGSISRKVKLNLFKEANNQPIAVYFSPHRSIVNDERASTQAAAGSQVAAYAESLQERPLKLREIAEWWLAQLELANGGSEIAARHLEVLSSVLTRFLTGYTNPRPVREPRISLAIDKGNVTLDMRQLSDGERSIVAMALELARRLSQANADLDDPLAYGRGVVLIDELDLHLHPRWQRTIVQQLTETFPNCQFIATTHSPQIVGEVQPENIILLESGQSPIRPDQSLGMDSNWILRRLMGVDDRNPETKQELTRIADLIESEQYDEATTAIDVLRDTIGDFPELVRLQTRIDRIQLLGQ